MIKIYKDSSANAIFIEDANGVQFINSLQATLGNEIISIHDLAKGIEIVSGKTYSSFVDKEGNTYGTSSIDVCNALNAVFSSSGTPGTQIPVITSNTSISLTEGQTLNYELTATYGVGYEWDLSNVPGVTTVEGNIRKIIGGSSLSAGSYNIPVKAINYNGLDSQTIVLTVATPPFSNTKSVKFNFQDYLGANASQVSNILGRSANGSGSGDAWSISFWFKGSISTNNGQTILYFGDSDTTNSGNINIRYQGGDDRIRFQYGSQNNYLRFQTANNSVGEQWNHILITYNGLSTGSSSGSISNYYSRFKFFINSTNVISQGTWSHNNFGWSGSVDPDNFRVGRYSSGNYMRDGSRVDELALWDSDQSTNVNDIYNSGTPHDLSSLSAPPKHWWRMGDGDTYPNLQDSGSEGNCVFVMYNMTAENIVNDVP